MTDYRWGRASGGEIPPDAVAEGHGWEYDTKDGAKVRVPVWLARSLPDVSGSVRVCRVRPGYGAALTYPAAFSSILLRKRHRPHQRPHPRRVERRIIGRHLGAGLQNEVVA